MANDNRNKFRVVAVIDHTPRMSFEVWYSQREKMIPPQHHREILKADFKGQGLSFPNTMAEFDKALKVYGVTLS